MIDSNLKKKLIERDGLRCAVTGEKVNSPDQLVIDQIKPKNKGGSSNLDNLILIKKGANGTK